MMKAKLRIWVFAVVVGLVVMAGQAKADIMFTLDGTLSDPGQVFAPGGPFGSITLADNGNNVNVTAALNTSYTIYRISLNWNVALGGTLPTAGWVASGNTITASQDNSGYYGWFDILVTDPSPGNPLMFTLSNFSYGNLDPSFFNTKDQSGNYYAVLRSGITEPAAYYGAKTSTVVPEPGILILLGISMASIVGLRRWWKE